MKDLEINKCGDFVEPYEVPYLDIITKNIVLSIRKMKRLYVSVD